MTFLPEMTFPGRLLPTWLSIAIDFVPSRVVVLFNEPVGCLDGPAFLTDLCVAWDSDKTNTEGLEFGIDRGFTTGEVDDPTRPVWPNWVGFASDPLRMGRASPSWSDTRRVAAGGPAR